MCLEIYELDPAPFLSAPGASWQAAWVKLDPLTDADMLNRYQKWNMSCYLPICES